MFEAYTALLYDNWAIKKLFTARGNPNTMLTPSNDEHDSDLNIAMNVDDAPSLTSNNYTFNPVISGVEDDEWFGSIGFSLGPLASPCLSDFSDWSSPNSSIYPSPSVSPISFTSTNSESLVSPELRQHDDERYSQAINVEMDSASSNQPSPPPPYSVLPNSPPRSSNSANSDSPADHASGLYLGATGSPSVKNSPLLSPLRGFRELPDFQGFADRAQVDFINVKAESECDGPIPMTPWTNWDVSGLDITFEQPFSEGVIRTEHQQGLESHVLPNFVSASTPVTGFVQCDGYEPDRASFDLGRRRAAVVSMQRLKALSDAETKDKPLQLKWRMGSSPASKSSRSRKKAGEVVSKSKSRRRKGDFRSDTSDENDWLASVSQSSNHEGGRYTFPDLDIDLSNRTLIFSPLDCDLCMNTGFKRSHDLKRHLSAIHQLRDFHVCEVCETEFCRSDALIRHLAGGVCKGPGKKRKRRMMKWEVEMARKEQNERDRKR